MIGRIIKIVSNTYFVEENEKIFECTARGKLRGEDLKPVVRRQCRV